VVDWRTDLDYDGIDWGQTNVQHGGASYPDILRDGASGLSRTGAVPW
jgi:hypothetical protein